MMSQRENWWRFRKPLPQARPDNRPASFIAMSMGRSKMNRKQMKILVFENVKMLDCCEPFEVFSATRPDNQREVTGAILSGRASTPAVQCVS
jgi:hypothetical protein